MPDADSAAAIQRTLPAQWSGFVTSGLNRSPLLDRLAQA
jgi:hypothetical protein